MESYIFTFGTNHAHPNGFVRVTAPSHNTARQEILNRYGRKWAFQYKESNYGQLDQQKYCPDGCKGEFTLYLHGYRMLKPMIGMPKGYYAYFETSQVKTGNHGTVWYHLPLHEKDLKRYGLRPI